jgi:cytidine deaminase
LCHQIKSKIQNEKCKITIKNSKFERSKLLFSFKIIVGKRNPKGYSLLLFMTETELIKRAKTARLKAYAPYSKFKVGAALLTKSGKVYTGANVENSTYGLTVCAERVAIFKAVSDGSEDFVKIVVAADKNPPITPCGACRQVLSEFAHDLEVVCVNLKGKIDRYNLKDLLPEAFEYTSTDEKHGKGKKETGKRKTKSTR